MGKAEIYNFVAKVTIKWIFLKIPKWVCHFFDTTTILIITILKMTLLKMTSLKMTLLIMISLKMTA